jgi:hypothetical protein
LTHKFDHHLPIGQEEHHCRDQQDQAISGTSPRTALQVTFDLSSVDTGVDLRNVRMRSLFFETFKYPSA